MPLDELYDVDGVVVDIDIVADMGHTAVVVVALVE